MNILSITNAGKRKHGDNHWFWAVWIEIDQTPDVTPEAEQRFRPYSSWNHTDPTASGFCRSKREANRAAWTAIKAHSPNYPRAYERSWARDMLWDQRANDTRPYFSRCKVGNDKWLWVVHNEICYWENEPIAHGYASTADAAQEQAETAVGSVQCPGNYAAEFFRTKMTATKRSQRTTTSSSTATLEFVFDCYRGEPTPYRIVKKSKKRIYVEDMPYREDRHSTGNWRDFVVDTFILDRAEFEATGKAQRKGRYWGTFYSDPMLYHAERRSTAYRPECFVGLDVPAGATEEEIHSAYRSLARQTHPDLGGNAEEFKRIQEWYEQAIMLVSAA
jgi:hypothetical protein